MGLRFLRFRKAFKASGDLGLRALAAFSLEALSFQNFRALSF